MEQDFHGNFRVNVTWIFAFFSGVLDWIVLILMWFKRSLHSAQVSGHISYPWPLKLITSQAVETKWIRTGGSGRLRGEWVKVVFFLRFSVFIFIKISPKMSISWGMPIQVWNRKWYMYLKHCFLSRLIQAVFSLFSVTWVLGYKNKWEIPLNRSVRLTEVGFRRKYKTLISGPD